MTNPLTISPADLREAWRALDAIGIASTALAFLAREWLNDPAHEDDPVLIAAETNAMLCSSKARFISVLLQHPGPGDYGDQIATARERPQ